jgi:hypothetical protein
MKRPKKRKTAKKAKTKAVEKPSVGRIIQYHAKDGEHSVQIGEETHVSHPAIVTGLNDDGTLDLTVFVRRNPPADVASVPYAPDGVPHPHTWTWPTRV